MKSSRSGRVGTPAVELKRGEHGWVIELHDTDTDTALGIYHAGFNAGLATSTTDIKAASRFERAEANEKAKSLPIAKAHLVWVPVEYAEYQ